MYPRTERPTEYSADGRRHELLPIIGVAATAYMVVNHPVRRHGDRHHPIRGGFLFAVLLGAMSHLLPQLMGAARLAAHSAQETRIQS